MHVVRDVGGYTAPEDAPNDFVERIRSERLSMGVYSIPAGGEDDQAPHREDEIYLVTAGRATLRSDSGAVDVGPGDAVYVPAGEAHRFVDIVADLAVVVFFAPAYTGRPDDVSR